MNSLRDERWPLTSQQKGLIEFSIALAIALYLLFSNFGWSLLQDEPLPFYVVTADPGATCPIGYTVDEVRGEVLRCRRISGRK